MLNTEEIARICHAANTTYCKVVEHTIPPDWDNAPDWMKASSIHGVEFALAILNDGGKPTPETQHNNWLADKAASGWKYGPVKDEVKKEHPCFVPYSDLPMEQRVKDYIFIGIVTAIHRASPRVAAAS